MTISHEFPPDLARLRESLCTFPSGDFPEAVRFASYAMRCVREVPPGLDRSVADSVADPRLRAAFEAAERWHALPAPDDLLLTASDAAIGAASESGGPDPRIAVGHDAAVWAVACAVASVAYAASIGTGEGPSNPVLVREEQGSDASRYALLAATCAAQAADAGHEPAVVRFQADLIRQIWPLPTPPTHVTPSTATPAP